MLTISNSMAAGKAVLNGKFGDASTHLGNMVMMNDLKGRSESTKIINGSVRAFILGALVGVNVAAIAVGVLKTTIIATFALGVGGLALFNWSVVLATGLAFGATAMILALVTYATYKLVSAASHNYTKYQESNNRMEDQSCDGKANQNKIDPSEEADPNKVTNVNKDALNLEAYLDDEISVRFGNEFQSVKRREIYGHTPTKAEVDAWLHKRNAKSQNVNINLNDD